MYYYQYDNHRYNDYQNNKRRYNAEGGNSMYRVRQWQRALDEANDHVEVLIKNREGGSSLLTMTHECLLSVVSGHEQRSQKERDTVDTGGRGSTQKN